MWTLRFQKKEKPAVTVAPSALPVVEYRNQTPGETLSGAAKYMSYQFNSYCHGKNVQCTVTSDPHDYKQVFHFLNLGTKIIQIDYDETKKHFLEPGESVTIKVDGGWSRDLTSRIPRLTELNGGL